MEIKIHGYKIEGTTYKIKLNVTSEPTEAGIYGGHIDQLEAKVGGKKILQYKNGKWLIPENDCIGRKIVSDCIEMFG